MCSVSASRCDESPPLTPLIAVTDGLILTQVGKMKRLGMEVKANMGVRMDGALLDG